MGELEQVPAVAPDKDDVHCYTINRYMIPAKVSYFLNNARYSLGDYLVLFYVQCGLSPSKAGLVNGIQHIGGMIAAPAFGLIADKVGYHRLIIMCLCLASILCVGIQPYFAFRYGIETSNQCPQVDNLNSTITRGTYMTTITNTSPLFYSLLFSALFASSFDGSIMSFNEMGVLRRVQTSPRESTIGMQRVMAALGTSLGTIAYSLSISYFPHGKVSCYVGLFITYFVLTLSLFISYFFLFKGLKIEKKATEEAVTSQVLRYFGRFETLFFLVTVFISGAISAIMFSYLFLYLKSLHAPTLLLGASMSLNCVSGIALYTISVKLIAFLGGTMRAMAASCFAWALRLLCLAFLVNPYMVLLIDIFHGFTFSLFRVASLEYIKKYTDPAIFGSVCGVVNSLSYSLSFLTANVAGGALYEEYGPQKLFLGTAVVALVWSFIMCIFIVITERSTKNNEPNVIINDEENYSL